MANKKSLKQVLKNTVLGVMASGLIGMIAGCAEVEKTDKEVDEEVKVAECGTIIIEAPSYATELIDIKQDYEHDLIYVDYKNADGELVQRRYNCRLLKSGVGNTVIVKKPQSGEEGK